jgi:hypothetical protein
MTKQVQQFTKVFHAEHGQGTIVGITQKNKDALCMCYFPQDKVTDWVLKSRLLTDTDDLMSLEPIPEQEEMVSDDLKDLITQAFFGGQPPQER